MKQEAYIFIGRSGSGKGTQVGLLKEILKQETTLPIITIETGDKFRSFIAEDGYSQNRSRKIYETDDRQPDFLACFMWSRSLIEEVTEPSIVIFDGTPRSLAEAKLLDTALPFYGFESVHIIHLGVTREWSEKHLLARGRSDDGDIAKIGKRLDWFDADVIPAVEYYKNGTDHHFMDIDGGQPIEKVHADILASLLSVK